MKVYFIEDHYGDSQDRQYFESRKIPYACIQVGVSKLTFRKDFAEWLVETQPLENASYDQDYNQFCELFKELSRKYPQYRGLILSLFSRLAPKFIKVDFDD
jgi:hypothetical protein